MESSYYFNRCQYPNCNLGFTTIDDLIKHVESDHVDFSKATINMENNNPEFIPMSYVLQHTRNDEHETQAIQCCSFKTNEKSDIEIDSKKLIFVRKPQYTQDMLSGKLSKDKINPTSDKKEVNALIKNPRKPKNSKSAQPLKPQTIVSFDENEYLESNILHKKKPDPSSVLTKQEIKSRNEKSKIKQKTNRSKKP